MKVPDRSVPKNRPTIVSYHIFPPFFNAVELAKDSRGGMHSEDVPLRPNVIPIVVAAQCYWMRKYWEFLLLRRNKLTTYHLPLRCVYRPISRVCYLSTHYGSSNNTVDSYDNLLPFFNVIDLTRDSRFRFRRLLFFLLIMAVLTILWTHMTTYLPFSM